MRIIYPLKESILSNLPSSSEKKIFEQVYIKGDVILGGLFSVHGWNTSTSSCAALDESGFKRLEAMMYALDQINNDSNILTGLTFGMDGFDTCASPRLAGEQVLRVISEAQFEQSGSGQRPNAQGELEHVYGFVGPNSGEECELVNGVLNVSIDRRRRDVQNTTFMAK